MNFFVDFTNQPQKIGSFLTLKSEFQLLCSLTKDKRNTVNFVPGPSAELNREFNAILKDDNIEIEIAAVSSDDISKKNCYPENILKELNDETYFSTVRLRFLYRAFGIRPSIVWSHSTATLMREFSASLSGRFLTFIIGLPYLEQDKLTFYASWSNLLKKLRTLTDLPFLIAGNDYQPEEISQISNTFSLASLGFSISQQSYLISESLFFMGTASGLCTPAMLSHIPYVIFKHPSYHSFEMKKELFDSRLPWASQHQVFEISEVSNSVFEKWTKEILYYAAQ